MKLLFRWINKLLCGWNVGLYFRPRIRYEGKKCLPAFTRGPAIIITNHKNQMDFLLVLYLFYFRYVRCLVGKTFYECNRFLNWCLRMLGAIKVDRFSFGMDFFCESVEALRRGQLLLIFPDKVSKALLCKLKQLIYIFISGHVEKLMICIKEFIIFLIRSVDNKRTRKMFRDILECKSKLFADTGLKSFLVSHTSILSM